MGLDIGGLKARVSIKDLISETQPINSRGKFLCPFHDDHNPSCHAFPDNFYCFACHMHGDHVTWLRHIWGLTFKAAIQELLRRADGSPPPTMAPRPKVTWPIPSYKPVMPYVRESYNRRAARLDYVPTAMRGRGFTLQDLRDLGFAAEGHNAIFPITGPDGIMLNIKMRFGDALKDRRYRYTLTDHGSPPWCSPNFMESSTVLIIEGELNGMACYLAAPHLAAMGMAGHGGNMHQGVLKGREVYVYGDADEVGQKACLRWADEASREGAARVVRLAPWTSDACDIAGRYGRKVLAALLNSLTEPTYFGSTAADSKYPCAGRNISDLGYSVSLPSRYRGLGGCDALTAG
jgi:DNA primase